MRIDIVNVKWYLVYILFCLLIGLLLVRGTIDSFVALLVPLVLSVLLANKVYKKK